jgi:hypothetical protein
MFDWTVWYVRRRTSHFLFWSDFPDISFSTLMAERLLNVNNNNHQYPNMNRYCFFPRWHCIVGLYWTSYYQLMLPFSSWNFVKNSTESFLGGSEIDGDKDKQRTDWIGNINSLSVLFNNCAGNDHSCVVKARRMTKALLDLPSRMHKQIDDRQLHHSYLVYILLVNQISLRHECTYTCFDGEVLGSTRPHGKEIAILFIQKSPKSPCLCEVICISNLLGDKVIVVWCLKLYICWSLSSFTCITCPPYSL